MLLQILRTSKHHLSIKNGFNPCKHLRLTISKKNKVYFFFVTFTFDTKPHRTNSQHYNSNHNQLNNNDITNIINIDIIID